MTVMVLTLVMFEYIIIMLFLNTPTINTTDFALILYPNPSSDQLHIDLPSGIELKTITIYNSQGENVAKAKTTVIPISHLTEGVYFAAILLSNKQRIVKKVVISRD